MAVFIKLERIEKMEDYLEEKGMLAVEAMEVRVLEDVYADPLDIISFLYIINFNPSVLFSFIIINKNPKEGIRHG
jgi:hypothetical protein